MSRILAPISSLIFSLSLAFLCHGEPDLSRSLLVLLPNGSKPISDHRFQSPLSYEDTKRHFHNRFSKTIGIKLIGEEINLPHVRTLSYKNSVKKSAFSIINIYLNVQTGITEIFFVTDQK